MRVSGNSGVVVLPRGRPSSLSPTRQHPHQTPERRCTLARHAQALGPLGSCSLGCAYARVLPPHVAPLVSVGGEELEDILQVVAEHLVRVQGAGKREAHRHQLLHLVRVRVRVRVRVSRGKPIAISCCTVSFATGCDTSRSSSSAP